MGYIAWKQRYDKLGAHHPAHPEPAPDDYAPSKLEYYVSGSSDADVTRKLHDLAAFLPVGTERQVIYAPRAAKHVVHSPSGTEVTVDHWCSEETAQVTLAWLSS